MKICLISSSGGHYEQLLMLKRLDEKFKVFFVTEKTPYNGNEKNTYYIQQINRKEFLFPYYLVKILFQTVSILVKEKPDVILSTGVLSAIPMLLLGKICRKKIIYIESFAKISTPTQTGKFIYQFADVFIVQWETLKKFYPNAVYLGSIY